jgi:hypothetical protein
METIKGTQEGAANPASFGVEHNVRLKGVRNTLIFVFSRITLSCQSRFRALFVYASPQYSYQLGELGKESLLSVIPFGELLPIGLSKILR